jgi:hypothetical protein
MRKRTRGWQTFSTRLETPAGNSPFEGQDKPPAERAVLIMERNPMANKTRTSNIHFMVTEEERAMIQRRMAQSGIKNMRSYLLKQAIDGRVIHIELDSVNEMVRLLSNATSNINQIARRVNETGNFYAADIEDLRGRYDELWVQTREILRRLSVM